MSDAVAQQREGPSGLADALDLVLEHMTVVNVRPGDVVVLRAPHRLTREEHDRVRETAEQCFPDDMRVIVVEGGMDVGVIRGERE